MKDFKIVCALCAALSLPACGEKSDPELIRADEGIFSLEDVAKIMSELPLQDEHLEEVYDAVSSSSGSGYDEEYTMSSLFTDPGSGVGQKTKGTKAGKYSSPLKDLFADYLAQSLATKSGTPDVSKYIDDLSSSDMQIYWPYSDDWDGKTYPILTFDPGYGAENNIGYEVTFGSDGQKTVKEVIVDEAVAKSRPVWVINRNDDAEYTPLEVFTQTSSDAGVETSTPADQGTDSRRMLYIKSIRALRNYDSWFGGASEFFVKCGAVDGFKATSDEDLKLYTPTVTDFMIVVKRSQIGTAVPFEAILLTDYTDQMDRIAFLVVEDDGGTTTSWKCEASVKYKSKTYGFDMTIPYHDNDDIVWRGQLSSNFFGEGGTVSGRFGDAIITFELK